MGHKGARDDLTAEYVRNILDYNPETGIFRWKYRSDYPSKWNTKWAGQIAGTVTTHVAINISKRKYLAHRLAWLLMTDKWPLKEIDHRDLNGTHNWWSNLREATPMQNLSNQRKNKRNTSGFKGVYYSHAIGIQRPWVARIRSNGIPYHIGCFDTAEQAHAAYSEAAIRLNGEFARSS